MLNMDIMTYVVTCTFDLRRLLPEAHRAALSRLDRLGLRPVPNASDEGLPARIVLGAFQVQGKVDSPGLSRAQFLRNSICFKLRELFESQGCEWNAFVLVSGDGSAWARMASRPRAKDAEHRWMIVLSESGGAADAGLPRRASGIR
jgi:hypothetical protein